VYHNGAEMRGSLIDEGEYIKMNSEIQKYNALLTDEDKIICNRLMDEINNNLTNAECKIWHGNPVWFINGNPIVGYSKLKSCIQLLFWSGASFGESLKTVGKYKAAEVRYTAVSQINIDHLNHWLNRSKEIQWDYKNLVKRQGVLERLM
jgi:hypothetical protein